MNFTSHNSTTRAATQIDPASAEATLRVIACLPAPEGLEDRVNANLKHAPRTGRILEWPAMLRPAGGWMPGGWMRGAAAAAIVFVVAGGGWGIYTRVEPNPPARVIVMPRAGTGGGFSSAGAMRTPQTLSSPVIAEPVTGQAADAKTRGLKPVLVKPLKKTPAQIVPMTQDRSKMLKRRNTSTQSAISPAK